MESVSHVARLLQRGDGGDGRGWRAGCDENDGRADWGRGAGGPGKAASLAWGRRTQERVDGTMTRRSRAREVALQLLFQRDFNPRVGRADIEEFVRARLR